MDRGVRYSEFPTKAWFEAQFDSTEMLANTFAVRSIPVLRCHIFGKTKVIDNFGPDGARESQVRLETPLIPFFPLQIAVFPSGGFFLAGQQYRADKPPAALCDAEGHLLKQLDWHGIGEERHAVNGSDDKAAAASDSSARSIAITGDDGYVHFMRAVSPPSST